MKFNTSPYKQPVIVIGKTSTGKSSLINLMIGKKNFMQTGSRRTTRIITEMMHGKDTEVDSKKDNKNGYEKSYTIDMSHFSSETGVPKEELLLYDIPGFTKGGFVEYVENGEVTSTEKKQSSTNKRIEKEKQVYRDVKNLIKHYGTVAIYVTEHTKLEESKKDIRQLSNLTDNFIVVMNKFDALDEEGNEIDEEEIQQIEEDFDFFCEEVGLKDVYMISVKEDTGINNIYSFIKSHHEKMLNLKKFIVSESKTKPLNYFLKYVEKLNAIVEKKEEKDWEDKKGKIKTAAIVGLATTALVGAGATIIAGAITVTALTGGLAGGPILAALAAFGPGGVAGGITAIVGLSAGVGVGTGLAAGTATGGITYGVSSKNSSQENLQKENIIIIDNNKFDKTKINEYISSAAKPHNELIEHTKEYETGYEDIKFMKIGEKYYQITGIFKKNSPIENDKLRIMRQDIIC